MTTRTAQRAGVRTRGRAAIAARTLRTDRWWAYPLTTFSVLLAFVAYATYAALANRGHAELDMHPLDARDRREVLRDRQGLGLCNITKCRTEVRPAGIKITDNAIIPMKERSADERYDPLGRVLRSWRRREDPPAG